MKVRALIRPANEGHEPISDDQQWVEVTVDDYETGRERIRAELVPEGWRVLSWDVPRDPATLEPDA